MVVLLRLVVIEPVVGLAVGFVIVWPTGVCEFAITVLR